MLATAAPPWLCSCPPPAHSRQLDSLFPHAPPPTFQLISKGKAMHSFMMLNNPAATLGSTVWNMETGLMEEPVKDW